MQAVLAKTGWKASDVDLYEVNEAFAGVAMAAIHDSEARSGKVNVNGGACALGHPIGATGARILTTLVHALKKRGGKRGIASLCIGGGEATALAVEIVAHTTELSVGGATRLHRDRRVRRNPRELVAALEVADVLGHPFARLFRILVPHGATIRRCASAMRWRACGTVSIMRASEGASASVSDCFASTST